MRDSKETSNESVTFRIDKNLLERLRSDAKEKVESLNMLVNQILKLYVDWYANAPKAQMLPFTKDLVIKFAKKLTDEDMGEIAKWLAEKETKNVVLLMKAKYDPLSYMSTIITWLQVAGLPYNYKVQDGNHVLVVEHQMGRKWSLFFSTVFRQTMQNIGVEKVEIETTDDTIVCRFSL